MEVPGLGTLLQHGIGTSPTVWTTIGQRVSIEPPTLAQGEKSNTTLDDVVEKPAATLPDAGELMVQVFWDSMDASHALLYTLFNNAPTTAANELWRLVLNDGADLAHKTLIPFTGWVKSLKPGGVEKDSNVSLDTVIRLTSVPTITPRS